jgi:hypothetical protein
LRMESRLSRCHHLIKEGCFVETCHPYHNTRMLCFGLETLARGLIQIEAGLRMFG